MDLYTIVVFVIASDDIAEVIFRNSTQSTTIDRIQIRVRSSIVMETANDELLLPTPHLKLNSLRNITFP